MTVNGTLTHFLKGVRPAFGRPSLKKSLPLPTRSVNHLKWFSYLQHAPGQLRRHAPPAGAVSRRTSVHRCPRQGGVSPGSGPRSFTGSARGQGWSSAQQLVHFRRLETLAVLGITGH